MKRAITEYTLEQLIACPSPVITTGYKHHNKELTTPDGTRVSVQASKYHYCIPRTDKGPYTHVELGFPSADPPGYIQNFVEHFGPEPIDYTECIYPYVPVELVKRWFGIEQEGESS